jgi:hypothetical protein
MSNRKRIDRLARLMTLNIDGYQLLIDDEAGNLIDGSGQIVYTPEEWERWQVEHLEAVIDLSKEG